MNIEELEEALEEIFPNGFHVETAENGELIIRTGLRQDDDGELVDFDGDEDEEDPDFDPDFEPLEEEEDEEE